MLEKLETLLYCSTSAEALRTDLGNRKGSEPCRDLRERRQILAFFWS
jgi:hypothetical protein